MLVCGVGIDNPLIGIGLYVFLDRRSEARWRNLE